MTLAHYKVTLRTIIDFKKTFNTVEFSAVLKTMEKSLRIDQSYIDIEQKVCKNSNLNIRLHEDSIEIIGRQGDVMSSNLGTGRWF